MSRPYRRAAVCSPRERGWTVGRMTTLEPFGVFPA